MPRVELAKGGGSVTLINNSVTQTAGAPLVFANTACDDARPQHFDWTLANTFDLNDAVRR